MTMIASKAGATFWPEAIPRDYEDLRVKYEKFVAHILTRYNRVGRNYLDLLQDVWAHIIQADVLAKYKANVEKQVPKTMSAQQACEFLGITFHQWRQAMWAYHNKGRKNAHWMPTPINQADFEARSGGKQKGFTAPTAIFDFDDVAQLVEHVSGVCGENDKPWFKSTGVVWPQVKATKGHFQSYLARAIHNHFANYCRTNVRKHKERTADTFACFQNLEDPAHWEHTIVDPAAGRQEVLSTLQQVTRRIHNVLVKELEGVEGCKPINDHEIELFDRLEEGYTLVEAVRKLDLPPRCKRQIERAMTTAVSEVQRFQG